MTLSDVPSPGVREVIEHLESPTPGPWQTVVGLVAEVLTFARDYRRALEKRAKKLKLPFLKVSGVSGQGVPELLEAMWKGLAPSRQPAGSSASSGPSSSSAGSQ